MTDRTTTRDDLIDRIASLSLEEARAQAERSGLSPQSLLSALRRMSERLEAPLPDESPPDMATLRALDDESLVDAVASMSTSDARRLLSESGVDVDSLVSRAQCRIPDLEW